MSNTYRSITYRYGSMTPWTTETDCYGFANAEGDCWNWKKKNGKNATEPWRFTKNLPKLKGQKLKHFSKRDRKPWHKPPHWYKQMREQEFRAKTKQALYNEVTKGNGNFPLCMTTDVYNWD